MIWQDWAMVAAGTLGGAVSLVHATLMHRNLTIPVVERMRAQPRLANSTIRILPLLLQLSSFAWFVGGLTLIASAFSESADAKVVTAMLVGSLYLYGAIGNAWATRGRHPGWALMALACVLLVLSLTLR